MVALAALGASAVIRRGALRVARATVQADEAYRGRDGFALKIDPEDHFQRMMLLGWFDPVLVAILRRYVGPGQVAIDAGGYIGYVTLHLAREVGPLGQVHTFECDPRLINRIREHVRLNGYDWVRVNELAVSDRSEEQVRLNLADQLGWSSIQDDVWEAPRTAEVTTVALDDYVRSACIDPGEIGLIKLDIEGAELRALEGMRETLKRSSAAVIVEFQPWRVELGGRQPSELLGLMESCGYEPWVPRALEGSEVDLVRGMNPGVGEDVVFLPR